MHCLVATDDCDRCLSRRVQRNGGRQSRIVGIRELHDLHASRIALECQVYARVVKLPRTEFAVRDGEAGVSNWLRGRRGHEQREDQGPQNNTPVKGSAQDLAEIADRFHNCTSRKFGVDWGRGRGERLTQVPASAAMLPLATGKSRLRCGSRLTGPSTHRGRVVRT